MYDFMRSGKVSVVLIVVLVLFVGLPGCLTVTGIGTYNDLKMGNNAVDKAAANVGSDLQKRMDAIPQLVEATKGVMRFERDTFTAVTEARSKVGQLNIDMKNLANVTPAQMQQLADAQQGLTGALSKLMVVMEKYPELKSNQNVTQLMDEIAGTENRINVSRKRYNDAVELQNNRIDVFPANIIAGMFNIPRRAPFEASEGANVAPKIDMTL